MRIKFKKSKQKEFLILIMRNSNCPSLGELCRRLNLNYATMKNYSCERRFLPEILFENLCLLGGIDKRSLDFEKVEDRWGQSLGGRKSRKN